MSLSLVRPQSVELKPRIVVFGVGGAGGNAVNNMIDAGLEGVEFVVANTDAQHLGFAKTDRRIQLGETITQGLGAGAHPEVCIKSQIRTELTSNRLPAPMLLKVGIDNCREAINKATLQLRLSIASTK